MYQALPLLYPFTHEEGLRMNPNYGRGRSISEDALQCECERVCLTFMATARVALASFSFSFLGATTRATLGRCKYRIKVHSTTA